MERTNTISHMTFATEWDHVNVAYISSMEADGEKFERPLEISINSDAVMKAVKELEKAVRKALGDHTPTAKVRTMREVRDEKIKALENAGASEEDARLLALKPGTQMPATAAKKTSRRKRR